MNFKPLLVEVLCEELPPRQVWALARDFPDMLQAALAAAGFADQNTARARRADGDILLFATPRRFAALLFGVSTDSPETEFIRRGPAVDACYEDGRPAAALVGFMRAVGVTCEQNLIRVCEKEREYIAHRGTRRGMPLADALAAIVERTLLSVDAPRLMRWGSNDFKFIRPVRNLLMLHGETPLVGGTLFGVAATQDTAGHPTLAARRFNIPTAAAYEETMEQQGAVVACAHKRKESIAAHLGEDAPAALLDEVAAMCEQPSVYAGEFDEAFLQLPSFCTEECLSKHQRAFPVYRDGRLTTRYFFVADNRPPAPAPMQVGFNAVVRARLRDVEFYIGEDRKLSAEDALAKLNAVTYHHKLGNQRKRVARLCAIAADIGARLELSAAACARLDEAATLCKCDLPTLMVGEYPTLAGLMAAEYFCQDNETGALVRCHDGRDWQRQTAEMSDKMPAFALLLATQLEKLVGMFGVGEKPSGSKDPHGLRTAAARAAAVLRETGRRLPLDDLLGAAAAAFDDLPAFDRDALWDFIGERTRQSLQTAGRETSALNAVLATRQIYIIDIEEKSAALSEFMQLPEAANLIEANKRSGNILRKSATVAPPQAAADAAPDESLFAEAAERALYDALRRCEERNDEAMRANQFVAVLSNTAKLQPDIGEFFEQVLVNAPDAPLRNNRLALLARLRRQLNRVGDLSLL